MIWWQESQEDFEEFKREMNDFPSLEIVMEGEKVNLVGDWPVYGSTRLIRTYHIRIEIPHNFPFAMPKVFETGNAIPKIQDRHFNPKDNSACLLLPIEQSEHWPLGSNISLFLNKPVKEFFFSQAFYELTGDWPFGSWPHGESALVQYCLEYLSIKRRSDLIKFLKYIEIGNRAKMKCPCGRRVRFENCHLQKFKSLINKLQPIQKWQLFRKKLVSGEIT